MLSLLLEWRTFNRFQKCDYTPNAVYFGTLVHRICMQGSLMKDMSTDNGSGNIDYTATIMSKEEVMEMFQYCCE